MFAIQVGHLNINPNKKDINFQPLLNLLPMDTPKNFIMTKKKVKCDLST